MHRSPCVVVPMAAAAILVGWTGCGEYKPAPPKPQAPPAARLVDYVTPDFYGAVIVRLKRILGSSSLEPVAKDQALIERMKESGLDPQTVDSIAVLLPVADKSLPKSQQDQPAVFIQFAEPVEPRAILTKMQRGKPPEEVTVAEKTCYKDSSGALACALDDRTLLMAGRGQRDLEKMLAAKGTTGPLIDRLGNLDKDGDIELVFILNQNREAVGEMLKEASRAVPAAGAGLAEVPNLAQSMGLTMKLTGDEFISATVDANDDASATQLEQTLRKSLEDAKKGMAEFQTTAPEVVKQQFGPLLTTASEVLGSAEIAKTGVQVKATVKRPPSIDGAVHQLAELIKAQAGAAGAPRP